MSKKKSDTSEETFQEGTTFQPRPKSPASPANAPEETFQEGTAPVQAFSSPAIAADSGPENRARRGRPPRVIPEKLPESVGAAAATQTSTRRPSEQADLAGEVVAAIGSALTAAGLEAKYPTLALGSAPAVGAFAAGAATGAAIGALLAGAAGAAIGAQVGAAMAAQTESSNEHLPGEDS